MIKDLCYLLFNFWTCWVRVPFCRSKGKALLDGYEEQLKIDHFDLAVDFGWFYFITKPIVHLLSFLRNILGSFMAVILALMVLLKLVFLPLETNCIGP